MLKVISLGNNSYRIECQTTGIRTNGDLRDMLDVLDAVDLEKDEFVCALEAMERLSHNIAYFGVNRRFVYSKCERYQLNKVA